MKKTLINLAASAVLIAAMSGCIADEPMYSTGEGTVYLSTRVSSDVKARSRADVDDLAASCDIWIANTQGIVRRFHGIDDVPSEGVRLVSGQYKAMVWAGDSVPASWTDRFFKGEVDFTIANNDRKSVEIVGTIANSVVAVEFDETVGQALADYSITVGHSQGSLTYGERESAEATRGYFMMNSRDKDLAYTLTGTLHDGTVYTREGSIIGCQPATLYTLRVKCTEESSEIGGAYFTIEVDETTIDHFEDITIDAAPEIMGIGFDIAQPLRAKAGEVGKRSVWIRATDTITGLRLECPEFKQLLGIGSNAFDFFQMSSDAAREAIERAGITYVYEQNDDLDAGNCLPTIKLSFREEFTDALTDGTYPVSILVTDRKGKQASATLTFTISDDPVAVDPVDEANVWAYRAYITMTVTKDGVDDPVVKYRRQGEQDWTGEASAASRPTFNKGDEIAFTLTGLEPATTYEYCAQYGDFFSEVFEFTTEEDAQLPNASFEDWHQAKANGSNNNTYYIFGSGGEMFWDSGNHGSATLNKSITTPTEALVHDGSTAIQLRSEYIVMKFAAGNVFIGKYLKTDGTDGVLGWGRPFASRPRQLKVWANYQPVNITQVGSGAPAEYVKGEPDRGIIYVALLDGYTESYGGESFPVVIQTKASSRRLFNAYGSDRKHVVAYGEHVFDANSPATNPASGELVEITIDLDYDSFDNNFRPSYILLTASASKGGDYFTGGNGSTLVLDDIQLVY